MLSRNGLSRSRLQDVEETGMAPQAIGSILWGMFRSEAESLTTI
jgi:hypothetical protein